MNTHQLNHVCPHCGRNNDATAAAGTSALPTPGQISACWGCRELAIFDTASDGRLIVRLPTGDEYTQMAADPRVRALQYAIRESTTPREAAFMYRDIVDMQGGADERA